MLLISFNLFDINCYGKSVEKKSTASHYETESARIVVELLCLITQVMESCDQHHCCTA